MNFLKRHRASLLKSTKNFQYKESSRRATKLLRDEDRKQFVDSENQYKITTDEEISDNFFLNPFNRLVITFHIIVGTSIIMTLFIIPYVSFIHSKMKLYLTLGK